MDRGQTFLAKIEGKMIDIKSDVLVDDRVIEFLGMRADVGARLLRDERRRSGRWR